VLLMLTTSSPPFTKFQFDRCNEVTEIDVVKALTIRMKERQERFEILRERDLTLELKEEEVQEMEKKLHI
jgi:hypothetical protein